MINKEHILYMRRAIAIAQKAGKEVKSNPQVGSVLVAKGRIIGEGYHQKYGEGHAEVNCIASVQQEDHNLIAQSTIYVTLEPCFHHGKTPPCVQLILKNRIPKVVIGAIDPFEKVQGKSVELLRQNGVEVITGILEDECKNLIRPFVKGIIEKKPWIILKWAKSQYHYMGLKDKQVWLSNSLSKLYVHRLRSNIDGILVGTNTAIIDNPSLTTRLVDGDHPIRIVLDRTHRIPVTHNLLADGLATIVITESRRDLPDYIQQIILDFESPEFIEKTLTQLYQRGIYRLMIEGGASTLKTFIQNQLWDEAVIINTNHELNEGIKAPHISGRLINDYKMGDNIIQLIARG